MNDRHGRDALIHVESVMPPNIIVDVGLIFAALCPIVSEHNVSYQMHRATLKLVNAALLLTPTHTRNTPPPPKSPSHSQSIKDNTKITDQPARKFLCDSIVPYAIPPELINSPKQNSKGSK